MPNGIGPHQGIEFNLMRSGDKHVALFIELEPDGLDDILAGGFKLLKFQHPRFLHFTWIVYREGFDQSAVRLRALVEQETLGFDPVREHEIGQILSYTPAQVDIFLQYAQKS
ncbi:MAG: hypothetical protein ABF241_01420 [Yoonia sp.]